MKKLLALLMALVFVFSFAACGSEDKKDDKKESTTAAETASKVPEQGDATVTPQKVDVSVYNGVLAKYKEAKKDYADNSVIDGTVDYTLAASDALFGNDLQYVFEEITGDETEELIVATKGATAEEINILNIWTVRNGKVEPLFKDTAFGYKAKIIPCASMTVLVSSYSGAFSVVYNAYDVEYYRAEPTFREAIGVYTNPSTGVVTYKIFDTPVSADELEYSTKGTTITEAEYNAFFESYAKMGPELFTWTIL